MLSCVELFVTLWIVVCQAPLPTGFFSGKNTSMGCHFLLQGIFLTQESNPCLLHLLCCRRILSLLSHHVYIYEPLFSHLQGRDEK